MIQQVPMNTVLQNLIVKKLRNTIDEEVSKLIELAYIRAKDILTKNKDLLKQLAEKLLEKEVIFKEDLEHIFGKRPYDKEELPLLKSGENDDTDPAKNPESTAGAGPFVIKDQATSETKEDKKDKDKDSDKEPEKPINTLF
jgi:hypothetical protein